MKTHFILFICFLLLSTTSIAQGTDNVKFLRGFRLITENDFFFPLKNKDENYTGQFRFDIYTKGILDKGRGIIFPKNMNENKDYYTEQSLFLHGMGYTPARRYFDSTSVVFDDRPFGSYVCIGYQRSALIEHEDRFLFGKLQMRGDLVAVTEIGIGKIGTDTPDKVQNFIHEYITVKSKEVKGWPNQIGHPGRFAYHLKLNYKYYAPIELGPVRLGLGYEKLGGYFMRYSKFSLLISNGVFDIFNTTIPAFVPESPQRGMCGKIDDDDSLFEKLKKTTSIEFSPSIKHVNWNTMLSGHPIDDLSIHTIDPENVKKWVLEFNLKLLLNFCNQRDERLFSIFYAMNWRGLEYEGGKPSHFYGSIGIRTMKF